VKMHGAVAGLVEAWKGGGSGTSTQEVPLLLSDLRHGYGGEKRVWKVRLGITELGEVAEIGHLPILGPPSDRYEVRAPRDTSPGLLRPMGN
jgi:hypothetical protein